MLLLPSTQRNSRSPKAAITAQKQDIAASAFESAQVTVETPEVVFATADFEWLAWK
jgi:hypothetical protein